MIYKWIFAILKLEKVKTFLSVVKRIRQIFEIKGTVNRKVGSGLPRVSTIKDDHRLEMNVVRKLLLTTVKKNYPQFF